MSQRGDWISFAELCARVPSKSGTTLRRYTREKLISSRQCKRGGRLEFNWATVERELAVLEAQGVNSHLAAVAAPLPEHVVMQELRSQRALLERIAQRVGLAS